MFPAVKVDDPATALMKLTYTQFLTKWLGVYAGKLEGLEADNDEFAHDFRTQFLNMGLVFTLVGSLAPISAWGGGVLAIPWEGATLAVSVMDPHGTPTDNSFDHAFEGGVTLGGEGHVTVKPFGLAGHQLVGFMWSDLEPLSLRQDPADLARRRGHRRDRRPAGLCPVLKV